MILYLTYNDAPSGIFSSQVIDVVKFLQTEIKSPIRLVSFISLRNYFNNRNKIKTELPNAIVLPMYPKIKNWRKNKWLLSVICIIYKPNTIIGRSVLATQLALFMRNKGKCKKVIYDGRGAISAEWKEYNVVNNLDLENDIERLEKEVVLHSDFRNAVSHALINYWENTFGYNSNAHVVIPCTLNKVFESVELTDEKIHQQKKELNINPEDVVFMYSGSLAGWQSLPTLKYFLINVLSLNINYKVFFLSDDHELVEELKKLYPNQVRCKKVQPYQVSEYLMLGDFGLLIRERSATNQVASPVKFAEYLACGLKVIISDEIGDYSKLVTKENLGHLVSNNNTLFVKPTLDQKNALSLKSKQLFSKNNFNQQYKAIVA